MTVRVRDGETLVSDGPFAETKEFVAGLDLLECVDLDEAIEVEAKSPVARFHPFEIRPFLDGLRLGAGASAFGREDDAAGNPYLLIDWAGVTPTAPLDDQAVAQECDAWRRELEDRAVLVLGGALGGPETATTIRFRDGQMQLSDGPFLDTEESSPASTSSAALIAGRRSSWRPHIRSPATTQSRYVRFTSGDGADG